MPPFKLTRSDPLEGSSCLRLSPPFHQAGADGSPSSNCFGFLWNTKLSLELQCRVLACLAYEDLFRLKCVSKQVKGFLDSNPFQGLGVELSTPKVTLTTPYFYIAWDGTWQCAGFDTSLNRWRRLPPLTYLPKPDKELFENFLVCAKGGLMCINVSKCVHKERLIVFNPLTGMWRDLPPLNHRRNPILMHMIVDKVTQSFQVAIAGSTSAKANFSKVTEVYDSCTSEWRRTGDLPGPEYALNEFQTGVHQDGNILCIAVVESLKRKGIVVYNVAQGRWLENWTPLPSGLNLQLVECSGKVHLFSEHPMFENPMLPVLDSVEQCVDMVEWTHSKADDPVSCALRTVIRNRILEADGCRFGFIVDDEFTCVPYGESQLCIFNVMSRSGVVYDVHHDGCSDHESQVLPPPPVPWRGKSFHSLNPLSFPLDLSFTSEVNPRPARPS